MEKNIYIYKTVSDAPEEQFRHFKSRGTKEKNFRGILIEAYEGDRRRSRSKQRRFE